MSRVHLLSLLLTLYGCSLLVAQDDERLESGPKAGTFLPAPFECFNINRAAKGRPHCLVCEFALSPAVLIFAREPVEGKDEAFNELVKQLDDAAEDFKDRQFSVGVIILSPDAKDSTNNAEEDKSRAIIEETVKRQELAKRLTTRAEKFNHAIMAYYLPEGPKKYNLNPKAEITILYYDRMKILDNFAFGPGKLTGKDVEAIVKRVRETVPAKRAIEAKQPKGEK